MYVGVDYYPEHWPESMMEEDMKGIVGLGANLIRIGEFAWHKMESHEGNFDFSYFDKVIAKAKANGLKVMFGTPTATFPAWLAKKHPSILSQDELGHVRAFGGRRQYCFNSLVYREYSYRITTKLVNHYANEETIIAWQFDNELGHEGSDMCYCSQCHERFQHYLERTYETIEQLNERYGTIFWGQTYNDFSEIPMPTPTVTTHNPTLKLDWARFRSFSVNDYTDYMLAGITAEKGEHQLLTTNVSGGFFDKWFDHERNVRSLDFVSYDNYPVWGGLQKPIPPAAIALTHDFNRGLLGKNYWIVEQLMGAQGHNIIGYLPRPNQAKMWSYQAFAHGCTDMLYFRWRGMTKGAEQFCFGVVDQDNVYGRKYKEVQTVFHDIKPYEHVLQSPIEADIAVLYDYDNIWSWRGQQQSENFDFNQEILRGYEGFYQYNAHMDVIPVSRDFTAYKVLVVPVMQIIDEALSERFQHFVENGGTIIFTFRAGLKDRDNNIHFGKSLPCLISDLAGIEIDETESLLGDCTSPITGTRGTSALTVWRDMITPKTAEVLYTHDDAFYKGKAAVTKNQFGKGTVYYLGGGVEKNIVMDIAKEVLVEKQIYHVETPEGLEVYRRNVGNQTYDVVCNHTEEQIAFDGETYAPYESKIREK
ncbi:beta-galactosidase [Longirhabdus pacifica]|uniref:beta-galactosidase n=1 Tax=Longirhabdus pacifica TaxID=2305227 RepID=UPI001008BD50|nr:beta-galactosidase [Longirhabdus pacifica]